MPENSQTAPAFPVYRLRTGIRIGDINYGGHLSNDAVLRLCHDARILWLKRLGFSETDTAGAGLIMKRAALDFRSQAFHGEKLDFVLSVSRLSGTGFTLSYKISDTATGRPVADVETEMVFFDYDRQKPVRMPEAFKKLFGESGTGSETVSQPIPDTHTDPADPHPDTAAGNRKKDTEYSYGLF